MKIHYKSPSEESALVSESNSKNSDPRKYLKNMTIITLVAIGIIMITINYKFLHTNEKNKPIMIESKLTRNKYPLNTNYKEYMTRQKKNNRGYLKLLMSTNAKKILSSVPEGSIFVLKDNSVLTDEEACSIEATLKAFPQRKVCILELSCGNYTEDDTGIMNFTKFLQTRNANMLRLRVDGEEYFKDSPLKGKWICDNDKSLFGAMALTVWMSNDEKLRLLFIEEHECEHGQGGNVSQGAAAVIGRWPSYVASAIWCIIFFVSLVTLLMLLIFMTLLNEGKIVEKNFLIPKSGGGYIFSGEIQSEFCNQMRAKRHEKRQEIPEEDLKLFDSGSNMFYMVMKPLNKFSACSIESVIRKCPDKNIFLMFLKKNEKIEFENLLKKKYKNFNIININGNKMLRGSPFEGKWKEDERSLFMVNLLTVWQFGGTVLSEYLLMQNKMLFEPQNIDCKIDPDLIFCPEQCASYVYDLIGVTLKRQDASMDLLLDESVKEFCGAEHLMKSGCNGVTRIGSDEMCDRPDESCMFVKVKEWLARSDYDTVWQNIKSHCPVSKSYETVLGKKNRENIKDNNFSIIFRSTSTRSTVKFPSRKRTKITTLKNIQNKSQNKFILF